MGESPANKGSLPRSIAVKLLAIHTIIVVIVGTWCLLSSGEMGWARSFWLMYLDFPLMPLYTVVSIILENETLMNVCLSALFGGALYAGTGWLIGLGLERLKRR